MTRTHRLPVRVYYEDTDAAGIAYHASYLRFAERGRTEFLRNLGFAHGDLALTQGVLFAVTRCVVDFLTPARLDDLVTVTTSVTKVGGARIEMAQHVEAGGRVLTTLAVTLAVLDARTLRPTRVPAALRVAFAGDG